jgi:intracellular sulfur oxidation DsrE/DsrF family protein
MVGQSDVVHSGKQTRRRALARLGSAAIVATAVAAPTARVAAAQEGTPIATPTLPPDFKVVLHAAQEQHWVYVLSNLRNLTQEWPEARLRIVVDGSAVLNLQGQNAITKALAEVAAAGVEVQVCPNALREHEIDPSSIPSYAQTTVVGFFALVLALL